MNFSEFSPSQQHPANESGKKQAFIDEWVLAVDRSCLYGHILCHYNQASFHTTVQQTSQLVRSNIDAGWAESMNTFYVLGEQADKNTLFAKLYLFSHTMT